MTEEQQQASLETRPNVPQVIVLEDDELDSDEESDHTQQLISQQRKLSAQQYLKDKQEEERQRQQTQPNNSISRPSMHSESEQEADSTKVPNQASHPQNSIITIEESIENSDNNTVPPSTMTSAPMNPAHSTNYNEIWATIAPQPSPSLRVLQQTMQLNELNANNTNGSGGDSTETLNPPTQHQGEPKSKKGSSSTGNSVSKQQKAQENKDDKPPVGSEEWHKLRRENHKQVERRRRETINDGINEIARIVPGCEKNKGSILQRAAAYIRQLKETEASSMEKWTLEKLLTDQAMNELNRQVEVLKTELDRIRMENSYLKRELEAASNHQHNGSKKQKLDHEN